MSSNGPHDESRTIFYSASCNTIITSVRVAVSSSVTAMAQLKLILVCAGADFGCVQKPGGWCKRCRHADYVGTSLLVENIRYTYYYSSAIAELYFEEQTVR